MTDAQRHQERQFPTRLVVAGIVLLLVVIFAIANNDKVKVDFIIFDISDIALFWVILASVVLGVVIGYLINMSRRARRN
jgi:uncharacterized integral membrane protein